MLGNGIKENKYWKEEKKRKCRVCRWREKMWEHVWEECTNWGMEKRWQEMVYEIFREKRRGRRGW